MVEDAVLFFTEELGLRGSEDIYLYLVLATSRT
jgi:hypothetical protein